jgi:alpha-tubulin suppressor-like RCC1 family protein
MKQKISQFFIFLVLSVFSTSFTPNLEAANSGGTVVAWGLNDVGEVTGTPALTAPYSATANPVILNGQTLTGVTAIAGGGTQTVALKSDGTVVVWGDNYYGQTTGIPTAPTDLSAVADPVTLNGQTLNGVTAIAAGYYHTVVLTSDSTVVAWGDNSRGQTTVPAGLSGITAIAAGAWHTVALKSDGTVVAWGWNSFGQTTIPTGLSGVTAIAASSLHTVALKSDGTVVAWGQNTTGAVTGTPTNSNVVANPVTLNGQVLSGVVAVAAADDAHTVALKSDGTVVAWGGNFYGEVTGTAPLTCPCTAVANPVTFNGQVLSGVTAIATGWAHTVALKNDGTLVAWGAGGAAQSGDPNYGQSTVPPGLNGVTAIAAGAYHTLALVPVTSPQDATALVVATINQLAALGTLNAGNANSLTSKLNNAIASINASSSTAAANQLQAFINNVNALVGSGRLPAATGTQLIDAANQIIALLGP